MNIVSLYKISSTQKKNKIFCKIKFDVVIWGVQEFYIRTRTNSTREILRSESWDIFFDNCWLDDQKLIGTAVYA